MSDDVMIPVWCPRHKSYYWYDKILRNGRCSMCYKNKLDTIFIEIDKKTLKPINPNYKIDMSSYNIEKPITQVKTPQSTLGSKTEDAEAFMPKKEKKGLKDWSG